MNTAKIAALYAQCCPSNLLCLPLAQLVVKAAESERGADGYRYRLEAGHTSERLTYRDELGERCAGFVDTYCPQRVAERLRQQLPGGPADWLNLNHDLADADQLYTEIWGYGGEQQPTLAGLRWGSADDLAFVLRGMASYQRKLAKQRRKTLRQLQTYHEQRQLRKGHWLGAEKALTTAARVDEPGLPYMGDAGLSDEQRRALGLHYWAVSEKTEMGPAFPAGTGLALQPVTRSQKLVDGAVYLFWFQLTEDYPLLTLGRMNLSRKRRGFLPLYRDAAPDCEMYTWAAWSNPSFKLYRVTHYTTRGAAPLAPMQAHTQPARPQPAGGRQRRRELALAA